MKRNRIFLFSAIAAVLVSCGKKGGMDFVDNEFPVETVKSQNASMQTTYPATFKGIQDVEIRPKVAGFITRVCVREGQACRATALRDRQRHISGFREAGAGCSEHGLGAVQHG